MTAEAGSLGGIRTDALARAARLARRRVEISGFPEMIEALRAFQDDLTGAAPPVELVAEIEASLTRFSAQLREYAVGEDDQVTGRYLDLPGRAQTLTPVCRIDERGVNSITGRVVFGRHYLGSNGAVHGGAIPLIFDEILGGLANAGGRTPSRTAYLHVDYRSITPIEVELRVEARFEREEGRKRFLVGELLHGDVVCAEAAGLFVGLRPGQP